MPSARAASQKFCTAHAVEYAATCGWAWRPSTWRPPRVESQVTTMLTGVSRIASTLSSRKARARGPGSPAANTSCCRRARASACSLAARSRSTMKSQGWLSPTLGAWCAAVSTRVSTSSATGSGRKPLRMSRRPATTWYSASTSAGGIGGAAGAAHAAGA